MRDEVRPIHNIGKQVKKIADEHGFKLVNFSFQTELDDEDAPPHATLVFEVGDKKPKPLQVITQADKEMTAQLEQSWRENLEKEAEAEKKRILDELDDKKLRKHGEGFLE